jgi:hypothetical protein
LLHFGENRGLPVAGVDVGQGVVPLRHGALACSRPGLSVEDGAEDGAHQQVVVAVGEQAVVGGRLPHAPGHEFVGRVADVLLAGLHLVAELARVGLAVVGPNALGVVLIAAGLGAGDEVPAQLAFDLGREGDGDDAFFDSTLQEAGEARADAGGINTTQAAPQ